MSATTRIEQGRYLTVEYKPHGLQLTLTAEGRELIEEQPKSRPDTYIFPELFEDFCGNGWGLLAPEHIGALTGCQIIVTDSYSVEDDGSYTIYGNIYWHANYAVESLTEELLKGPVTLPLAHCGECETEGWLCSGVPGVLADLESLKTGQRAHDTIMRCDACQRYAYDEDAAEELFRLGIVPNMPINC